MISWFIAMLWAQAQQLQAQAENYSKNLKQKMTTLEQQIATMRQQSMLKEQDFDRRLAALQAEKQTQLESVQGDLATALSNKPDAKVRGARSPDRRV